MINGAQAFLAGDRSAGPPHAAVPPWDQDCLPNPLSAPAASS